ncbi:MAG: putative bifunctional diguanylate cyclase/phosphodiesterase [Acidimicrobiales bacterium]
MEHDDNASPVAAAGAPSTLDERIGQVARGHRRVLELIAKGAPLEDTLGELVTAVEMVAHGARCSVMLLSPMTRRLRLASGPGLSRSLRSALEDISIDEERWPSVEAIRTNAFAVRTDLDVSRHGFESCWSTPITSTSGELVGTLDLWFGNRREPKPTDVWLVELAVDLAGIAIEREDLVKQLHARSLTDPLTGLPHRQMFTTVVRACLDGSLTTSGHVAVLAVDLDRFKLLNNSLGHEVGNKILNVVADRLRAALRPEDMVSRFHADEFLILLSNVHSAEGALQVASRIRAQLQEPIEVVEREVFVMPSIGVALQQDGAVAESMIEQALSAMHRAKEKGWGGCEIYDTEISDIARRRLDLEQDLWRAVERDELTVLYQPIVKLSSQRPVAVEALVRWNHRTLGQISPADFIPLAEESGAIVPIGGWVLETACRQAAAWSEIDGLGHLKMSVNISPRQFHQPDFVAGVAEAIERSGISPGRLILEITEGVVMSDVEAVLDTLQELKDIGIRLSVDDFGAGYSSLSYLKRFPLDSLKIDKSFISAVDVGPADHAIVEAVIVLASRLGLRVVAEGVEATPQADLLRELGCGLGQGYLFSRPVSPGELETQLRRRTPLRSLAG